jgi:hypothetical protein
MDVAVVALTAALVMTTALYPYFTWRMADEMQKARVQALRPRLLSTYREQDPALPYTGVVDPLQDAFNK